MIDWIKSNVVTIVILIVTMGANYIVINTQHGARITALEERQDRQGVSMQSMQAQITGLANDVSGMKAQLTSISENVNYIRNRIDRITN